MPSTWESAVHPAHMGHRSTWMYWVAVVGLSLSAPAHADVLLDQVPKFGTNIRRFANGEFTSTGSSAMTTYFAARFIVPAGGWRVDSIGVLVGISDLNGEHQTFPSSGTARLMVFQGNFNALRMADPALSPVVPFVYQPTPTPASGNYGWMSTSGLALGLDAGEYWLALTPILQTSTPFPRVALGEPFDESVSAFINPSGAGKKGTDWVQLKLNTFSYSSFDPSIPYLTSGLHIDGTPLPPPSGTGLMCMAGLRLSKRRR